MNSIGVADIIFMFLPGCTGRRRGVRAVPSAGLLSGRRAGSATPLRRPTCAPPRAPTRRQRDAADLALKGPRVVPPRRALPPFVLVGLVPLFYGGRKLIYASMGLGLVDDGEQPGA